MAITELLKTCAETSTGKEEKMGQICAGDIRGKAIVDDKDREVGDVGEKSHWLTAHVSGKKQDDTMREQKLGERRAQEISSSIRRKMKERARILGWKSG